MFDITSTVLAIIILVLTIVHTKQMMSSNRNITKMVAVIFLWLVVAIIFSIIIYNY